MRKQSKAITAALAAIRKVLRATKAYVLRAGSHAIPASMSLLIAAATMLIALWGSPVPAG